MRILEGSDASLYKRVEEEDMKKGSCETCRHNKGSPEGRLDRVLCSNVDSWKPVFFHSTIRNVLMREKGLIDLFRYPLGDADCRHWVQFPDHIKRWKKRLV